MSDWNQYTIDDLFIVQNGYAFKSNEFIEEQPNTYEVLKMGHIERGGGLRKSPRRDFIPKQDKLKNFVLDKNDIVMAMTDMKDNVVILGVPAIIDKSEHYVLNQRVARLKLRDPRIANIFFIYNYLKWDEFLLELQSKANSGVQVNLSTSTIKESILFLPSKDEQDKIANLLNAVDSKIDLLYYQGTTIDQLASALFLELFIETSSEEWKVTTLSEHTVVFRGLSYKGSGLSEVNNGLPMHNLNSVYEGGGYKYEGIKFYNGEYRDRHLIYPGDIIVTNTEQGHELKLIGFPAVVPKIFGDFGLFSQHIYRFIPNNETYLTKEFLYYLLMTPQVREQIVAATNGSTVNMLALDGLQRPEFKLPPRKVVQEFTNQVIELWRKKEQNQIQISILQTLRATLIPKFMNHEICLP